MTLKRVLSTIMLAMPALWAMHAQSPADSIIVEDPLAVAAQSEAAKIDTIEIVDLDIVYPSSFDIDTRNLQDNWYLQRYAVLDSMARTATRESVSDEVYISRLQRLPNVIEMPYNSIIRNYIEYYVNRKPELVEKMLGMSLYYMPIFEDALEKYQLPQELKYLPIVESALDPNAVSKAGACGLWQFMSSTAIGEGLEVNSLVDQRRDPIASSDAAARYLKKLYEMYGDWNLAIAAYNCGPGNINKAIKKANDRKDYWQIYFFLPKETRGYVPSFIAANYIMNYYAEHGIPHALARKPIVTDTVQVSKRVHFQQIADVMGIPIDELRILNPQYRSDIVPGHIHPYTLVLPSLQAYCYAANEDSIINYRRDEFNPRETVEPTNPNSPELAEQILKVDDKGQYLEDVNVVYHKVKKGETIKTIANSYGVSVESIRQANHLSSSRVKTGKTLKINVVTKRYVENKEPSAPADSTAVAQPKELAQNQNAEQPKAETKKAETQKPAPKAEPKKQEPKKQEQPKTQTYTVQKGDNLSKIANKFGITIDQLKKQNGLKNDVIQIGQKLTIPAKGGASAAKAAPASQKSAKKKKK